MRSEETDMHYSSLFFKALGTFSIFLLAFSGCDTTLEFSNSPPGSITIERDICYLGTSDDLSLCGEAVDPEEDEVTYRWTCPSGAFYPSNGEGGCVLWTSPAEAGSYTMTLHVSDGIDESTKSIVIEVGENLAGMILPGVNTFPDNGSFYLVEGDEPLEIMVGTTFVFERGAEIVIDKVAGGLFVEGTLVVEGTAEDPVSIKPNVCPGESGLWEGIRFAGESAAGTMSHFNISSAVRAIVIEGGASVTMDTCSVTDCVGRGVAVSDSGHVYLNGCKIWENGGGVLIEDSFASITGSSVRYNTVYGIFCSAGEDAYFDVTVTGGEIANNIGDGFLLSGYSDPLINGNAIFLNEPGAGTGYNIKLYNYVAAITIDATGNYWGYTTEMDIAASIYDGMDSPQINTVVDFSGWLPSAP